jgi:hypothetical protein
VTGPGWTAYRDERRLTRADRADPAMGGERQPQGMRRAAAAPAFTAVPARHARPDPGCRPRFPVPADGPTSIAIVIPTKLTEDKWIRAVELSRRRAPCCTTRCSSPTPGGAPNRSSHQRWPPGSGRLDLQRGGYDQHSTADWAAVPDARVPPDIMMLLPGAPTAADHFSIPTAWRRWKTVIGLYFGPKPA